MTTTVLSTALAPIQPAFTDPERLALAGFLAGYLETDYFSNDGSVLHLVKVASVDGPLNLRGLAASLIKHPRALA